MATALPQSTAAMIRRISITGPESTGKSWLAEKLAGHFDEPWVPEFSRSYLQKLDRPYEFSDIAGIAEGQYASENSKAEIARRFLFCDTDFLVCHIWCRVKYGKSHPWIEQMVNRGKPIRCANIRTSGRNCLRFILKRLLTESCRLRWFPEWGRRGLPWPLTR